MAYIKKLKNMKIVGGDTNMEIFITIAVAAITAKIVAVYHLKKVDSYIEKVMDETENFAKEISEKFDKLT